MILTEDEIRVLTGRRFRAAQARALRFMGIEHKIRPDGSIAVLRAHAEQVMGLQHTGRATVDVESNWSAM